MILVGGCWSICGMLFLGRKLFSEYIPLVVGLIEVK